LLEKKYLKTELLEIKLDANFQVEQIGAEAIFPSSDSLPPQRSMTSNSSESSESVHSAGSGRGKLNLNGYSNFGSNGYFREKNVLQFFGMVFLGKSQLSYFPKTDIFGHEIIFNSKFFATLFHCCITTSKQLLFYFKFFTWRYNTKIAVIV
jgi:hypothetical protein